jgi:ATP-dependent Clp protease ATP-binding subunit ClpA
MAVFLAIHLTTVTQYLRREPAVRQASKNAETAKGLIEVTRQIAASIGKLVKEQADQTKAITETFVKSLEKDFSEVDDEINLALRELPPGAQRIQPQQQQALDEKLQLAEDLAKQMRAAGTGSTDVVDSWIEKSIIQPRLDELSQPG